MTPNRQSPAYAILVSPSCHSRRMSSLQSTPAGTLLPSGPEDTAERPLAKTVCSTKAPRETAHRSLT